MPILLSFSILQLDATLDLISLTIAGKEIAHINAEFKKLKLTLKQLIDTGANDRMLEPSKSYPLEVYGDRVPIYIKIHLKKDKNPVNIYMRIDDKDELHEAEELVLYLLVFNKI